MTPTFHKRKALGSALSRKNWFKRRRKMKNTPQITLRFKAGIRPMEGAIEAAMKKPAHECRPWVEYCTHGFDEDQEQADAIRIEFPARYEDKDGVKPTLSQFLMIIALAMPHCDTEARSPDTQFDIVASVDGVEIAVFVWDDRWAREDFNIMANINHEELKSAEVNRADKALNDIWHTVREYLHG